VCGQEHGLGEANVVDAPAAVAVDRALYADYAGRYGNAEFDQTIAIALAGGRLEMRVDEGAAIELIPQSPTRFLAPGALAPVSFVRDASGRVVRLLSHEVDDIAFERLDDAGGNAQE
jgi:hypothetical protein